MSFAFAGTPRFGAWVLGDLVDRGLTPSLVVSQPDRPAGRGRVPLTPPVVTAARSCGLPVLQTADINAAESVAALAAARVEHLVVAAFGQLLRAPVLDRFECVNVHASLLPKYRGAAPIARALMAGETETGVSIMRMTAGLDEGPVASTTRVSVGLADTAGEVTRVLALLGALGIERLLTAQRDGTARWVDQTGDPTYAAKLTAVDRRFDPTLGARRLHDRVRALAPDVGCDAETSSGLRLKVWRTWPGLGQPGGGRDVADDAAGASRLGPIGTCRVVEDRLLVSCADGPLELCAVQPAGKRIMHATEFVRGYRERLGESIGPPPPPSKED